MVLILKLVKILFIFLSRVCHIGVCMCTCEKLMSVAYVWSLHLLLDFGVLFILIRSSRFIRIYMVFGERKSTKEYDKF